MSKRVACWRANLRVIAPTGSYVTRLEKVAVVASRWQLCSEFDLPEVQNLSLQRQTCCCLTNPAVIY